MVKTMQTMKRVDEIKAARQLRFFNARMAKHVGQKKSSTMNELMVHVDLISNPKVKAFIAKKKQEKFDAKRIRQTGGQRGLAAREARLAKGIHGKMNIDDDDADMVNVAESEDEQEPVKEKAKIKVKMTRRKSDAMKLTKKRISKS